MLGTNLGSIYDLNTTKVYILQLASLLLVHKFMMLNQAKILYMSRTKLC
jgi:hypothetical protein